MAQIDFCTFNLSTLSTKCLSKIALSIFLCFPRIALVTSFYIIPRLFLLTATRAPGKSPPQTTDDQKGQDDPDSAGQPQIEEVGEGVIV